MLSAGKEGEAVSPVRRKIPSPGKYGSIRDVVRLKQVPKKNANVVVKKSFSVAVDPFMSSDESDTEESSGAVYTRLGLIANMSLRSCATGDGKGATTSTGIERDAMSSVVKKKVPVTMFSPKKYGPIGDVVRLKPVPKGNRVPKKNTKIARTSVFLAAVDPIVSSAKADTEKLAAVIPTRSELIDRFWRAMLLPSEQCRQAIGGIRESGRPMPNNRRHSDVNPDVLTRDSRRYLPNHSQIFDCLAKVIPLPHVARFNAALEEVMRSNCGEDGGSLEGDILCKTPLTQISATLCGTFGSSNVDVRRCHNIRETEEEVSCVTSDYFLEFVMMDCVLERSFKIATSSGAAASLDRDDGLHSPDDNDPVTHVLADCVEELAQRHDYKFRTAIIVVPSASVFYCARERRKATHGVAGSHNPLDIGWLRIKKWQGDGVDWFQKGGYVRHLSFGNENPVGKNLSPTNPVGFVGACSVWNIGIKRAALRCPAGVFASMPPVIQPASPILVYSAYQCPDDSGPRLPPDIFDGKDKSKRGRARLRDMYNSRLIKATSVRKHCRCYVRGAFHCCIPAGTLIIDPLTTPNVDIKVKIQFSDPVTEAVAVMRESVVQIRYLPEIAGSDTWLESVRDHARMVAENTKGQARSTCGDLGSMHPIGTRVLHNKTEGTYVSSSGSVGLLGALRDSVVASAMLAQRSIPGVLRVIQDLETDSGVEYIPEMSGGTGDGEQRVGMHRISTTMDLSVNLANASHYDVNDASQGFSIWTEDKPGTTANWYFVLPNVYGHILGGNETYNGLAIKLTHGVLISWDGRVIRHCTSMMERISNVYGTFFAVKLKNIALGQRQCESELQAGLKAAIALATTVDSPDDDCCDVPGVEPMTSTSTPSNGCCATNHQVSTGTVVPDFVDFVATGATTGAEKSTPVPTTVGFTGAAMMDCESVRDVSVGTLTSDATGATTGAAEISTGGLRGGQLRPGGCRYPRMERGAHFGHGGHEYPHVERGAQLQPGFNRYPRMERGAHFGHRGREYPHVERGAQLQPGFNRYPRMERGAHFSQGGRGYPHVERGAQLQPGFHRYPRMERGAHIGHRGCEYPHVERGAHFGYCGRGNPRGERGALFGSGGGSGGRESYTCVEPNSEFVRGGRGGLWRGGRGGSVTQLVHGQFQNAGRGHGGRYDGGY
jgi:hypothetical protein